MKKMAFLFVVLALLFSFAAVFAEQDGYNCWCNVDQYGCWITNESGGQDYLMFWSESARQFFMGSSTPPYKDVTVQPDGLTLPLVCGVAPVAGASSNSLEAICTEYAALVNQCYNDNAKASECVAFYKDNGGAAQAKADLEAFKSDGCQKPQ